MTLRLQAGELMKMVDEEIDLLNNILDKLDLLIALMKINNQNALSELKIKFSRDKITLRILELADGSITYSNLANQIHEETGMAEITIKKKMSELRELGLLTTRRDGKETYYDNSGLLG